jgi:hypothetical protein
MASERLYIVVRHHAKTIQPILTLRKFQRLPLPNSPTQDKNIKTTFERTSLEGSRTMCENQVFRYICARGCAVGIDMQEVKTSCRRAQIMLWTGLITADEPCESDWELRDMGWFKHPSKTCKDCQSWNNDNGQH